MKSLGFTLITPGPFPAWAAVAGPRDVVTGGVVQAITDLAASIPVCALRTLCTEQKQAETH